jgi:catechol 2,3-dioxygenase-like lactoylglutathione lyase family enzyme
VIDHIGLGVSDLERSRAFYEQALAPLGYQVLVERDGSLGFGHNAKPDFFIHINRPLSGPTHVAIASPDRATVDAFHAAGLAAAGGRDNGPPRSTPPVPPALLRRLRPRPGRQQPRGRLPPAVLASAVAADLHGVAQAVQRRGRAAPCRLPACQAVMGHPASSLAQLGSLTVIPPAPTAPNQTALNRIPVQPHLARPYWTAKNRRWQGSVKVP